MSLTDDIYRELMDGLGKDLDYTHFQAKYRNSKGSFYNAFGRFIRDMEPKVRELSGVQAKLDAAGLTLDQMHRQIKEAEANLALLVEEKNALNEGIETLEVKLAEKGELAKHLAELEKLGFDSEKLKQLQDALRQTGKKHGLNSKEAVSKFFGYLKDYDLVLEAEVQLKGLQTQIETKKLEAENWRAKEEALRRKHDDLKEALEAVHALRNRGIKVRQIIIWHQILTRFQTVEQLVESLAQYGDIIKLLNAKKEETENWELRLANAQGQVEILKKEKNNIEGAINALKKAGVKELKAMTEETIKQMKALAVTEIRETRSVGQEVRNEFSNFLAQLDALAEKVLEIGEEFERTRQELQKYEDLKNVLESHAAASEAENEIPEQS